VLYVYIKLGKNEMLFSALMCQAKLASENVQRQDFISRTGKDWSLITGRQTGNPF